MFLGYYMIFYLVILDILPSSWMNAMAPVIEPYYVTIRYVSILVNILICAMTLRFLARYLQYKKYMIRKRTLSFVLAASIVQLFSFFCYTNLPSEAFQSTEQLTRLQQIFWSFRLHIVELIALFLKGYVLAFYVGALSRVKFLADVVLAPRKPMN